MKMEYELDTGVIVKLIEDAYPSDHGSSYQALASGNDGCQYMLYWDVVDPYCDDGANACNWDDVADYNNLGEM